MRLTLKPFGKVDEEVLEHLRKELRMFDEIVVAPEGEIPAHAYERRSDQYRAGAFLDAAREEPGDRVLGVTDVDLREHGLNFVFGLATKMDRYAVISLARLGGDGRERLLERAVKEAVHEIGHTLGLEHDRNPVCVMHFSERLEDTDLKGRDFCPTCRSAAEFTLKRLRR